MDHHAPLLTTIAVGLVAAFVLGMIAQRIRLSPIVGYLAAGLIIGPFTPGFVADVEIGAQLAEIGVVLLMFGVGLHFSLGDLLAVKRVALPGAVTQMVVATALGAGLGLLLGWSVSGSLLFGLSLSVASTVVMLRALEERQLLDTRAGHIAVGWLIVEDLAMVIALVIVPVLAAGGTGGELGADLAITLLKVSAFVAIMLIVGKRAIPWVLERVAGTGSRELFTLAVLALGLGVAVGAAWMFDVSFALGAFFAGMMLKESPLAHRAAEDSLPLRDAFAVLFFVSVGMLVDPRAVLDHPLQVLATTTVIVLGKFAAAFLIVKVLRYSTSMSILAGAALAQIGEFSFILITLGVDLDVVPEDGRNYVLAGAILSILINPLLFAWAARAHRRNEAPPPASAVPPQDVPAAYAGTGHAIVIGDGRVGARATAGLIDAGIAVVVIDDNEDRVAALRARGQEAILGNAARAKVLAAAGIGTAKSVLVAIPDPITAGVIVEQARRANPAALIVARGHNETDEAHLRERGADRVLVGVYEVADLMVASAMAGEEGTQERA